MQARAVVAPASPLRLLTAHICTPQHRGLQLHFGSGWRCSDDGAHRAAATLVSALQSAGYVPKSSHEGSSGAVAATPHRAERHTGSGSDESDSATDSDGDEEDGGRDDAGTTASPGGPPAVPVPSGYWHDTGEQTLVRTILSDALPIIVTAPHGGSSSTAHQAEFLRERPTRPGVNKLADTQSAALAMAIVGELGRLCGGQHPSAIIARFHRRYVDANRRLTKRSAAVACTQGKLLYGRYHAGACASLSGPLRSMARWRGQCGDHCMCIMCLPSHTPTASQPSPPPSSWWCPGSAHVPKCPGADHC